MLAQPKSSKFNPNPCNVPMASVIGKGDNEGLRKVEKDVLITKKVREKAMELCNDLVKGMCV